MTFTIVSSVSYIEITVVDIAIRDLERLKKVGMVGGASLKILQLV